MSMVSRWGIGASILMYHSITNNSYDEYTVAIDDFQKQISWLNDNGFEVIPLSLLLQLIQNQDYSGLHKKVVITFDDGFEDFVTNALPILLEYDATATVFLVTDMFGGSAEWNKNVDGARLMTEDEARYIKEKGISLGSHTAAHVNLKLADHDNLQRQLKESYDTLTRLGESFYSLAYPWGQWSDQVANVAKSTGYECALAVGEQTRLTAYNGFQLPRVSMTRDLDLMHFQSLLNRTNLEKEMRRKYWMFRQKGQGFSNNNKLS